MKLITFVNNVILNVKHVQKALQNAYLAKKGSISKKINVSLFVINIITNRHLDIAILVIAHAKNVMGQWRLNAKNVTNNFISSILLVMTIALVHIFLILFSENA